MTQKLLPCPFCDGEAKIGQMKHGFYVYCPASDPAVLKDDNAEKFCDVPNVVTDVYPTQEEAIENWNWRIE
jgi:hypothetical protein